MSRTHEVLSEYEDEKRDKKYHLEKAEKAFLKSRRRHGLKEIDKKWRGRDIKPPILYKVANKMK